jgi:hypothetical protein
MIVFKTRHDALVRTTDGRNFVVQENIDVADDKGTVYRVPIGATTDGCSIPQFLWSTSLAPFGPWWLAAVVHDAAYRNVLLQQTTGGGWELAALSKDACDTLFLDCMKALGVDAIPRDEIYEGVHLGGWKAFKEDRA